MRCVEFCNTLGKATLHSSAAGALCDVIADLRFLQAVARKSAVVGEFASLAIAARGARIEA